MAAQDVAADLVWGDGAGPVGPARMAAPPIRSARFSAADPGRFERFSWAADGLLLDLSKTALTEAVLAALLDLARATGLAARRDAMVAGQPVNTTEGRAVLHLALRARPMPASAPARRMPRPRCMRPWRGCGISPWRSAPAPCAGRPGSASPMC